MLTQLGDFAPPTIMGQAARLTSRQRFFNLVVTNVPGPQFPLYLLGRELQGIFPMVPLAENQAICFGIMSYNGQVNFGLTADYDAMPDVDALADDLRRSIDELATAVKPKRPKKTRAKKSAKGKGKSKSGTKAKGKSKAKAKAKAT
jgi:diacylglycerol O-acyltransferase / wax synthase